MSPVFGNLNPGTHGGKLELVVEIMLSFRENHDKLLIFYPKKRKVRAYVGLIIRNLN